MTLPIVILGAGGFAKEVAFLIEEINRAKRQPMWKIMGYIGATPNDTGKFNGKYRVIGDEEYLMSYRDEIYAVISVGSPPLLDKIYKKLGLYPHIHFPNLIHPNVVMDTERITMGEGNIICAGNIFTTDISIGNRNVFNLSCTYGHDVVIGNHCVFNPGINMSGGVVIEDRCLIGTGATILQYLKIGTDAKIGAGAVVTKNVEAGVTVVGVPAKPMTSHDNPSEKCR